MNFDKVNKWLTLIANIAVLGGIAFLALEIRQNTNAIRSTAVQELTAVARQHPLMYVQNPEVNRLAMADYDSLSEEDKRRRMWLNVSNWHAMQGLFRQNKLGTLPEPEWEVWVRIICSNYERRVPELWQQTMATHAADFIQFVESCESGTVDIAPR